MNITTPQATASPATARQAPTMEGGCPHGAPRGACPLCSGAGGGGGGGRSKTAGLMTWNEAYAVWNSLRIEKARNEDYLKGLAISQARMNQEQAKPTQGLLMNFLARYAPALANFFANPPQLFAVMARGMAQLSTNMQNALISFRNTLIQTFQGVIDISDKLAAILGDSRKLLEDILHHNVENLKALLSRLQLDVLMQHVDGLMKQVLHQFAPRQVLKTIERRIRSVLSKIFGRPEEAEEELDPLS